MVTNITGFQMARRRAAEKAAKELAKDVSIKDTEVDIDSNEVITNVVEKMSIEEVKEKLVELGISFQPNTGEAKLRAKLEGAINDSN